MILLSTAKPFHEYRILAVGVRRENTKRRLAEFGFLTGNKVVPLYRALLGGIRAYQIKGSVIAVRDCDADEIYVGDV